MIGVDTYTGDKPDAQNTAVAAPHRAYPVNSDSSQLKQFSFYNMK